MVVLAAALLPRLQSSAPPAKPTIAPARAPEPATRPAPTVSASALVRRGHEAAQTGAAGDAARLFRQAIELEPRDPETWNNLGVVLARQGETTEAVDAFRRALALRPGHAEAHRNLGVVLDRRGRSAEAITHYRAFLASAGPTHPARDGVSGRLAELGKGHP